MRTFFKNCFRASVLFVFFALSNFVNAATISSLFNTGVDNTGAVLPHGTVGDPHYSLVSTPSGTTSQTRIITSAGGYPVSSGLYTTDNSISRWIGPNNDDDLNGSDGDYVYRTSFVLDGNDPNSASITGNWATDNPGVDILLNEQSLGLQSILFTASSPFTINRGFISGVNVLDFVVRNLSGPTALRVEFDKASATPVASNVPVPAALWLFGSAIISLIGVRRKL